MFRTVNPWHITSTYTIIPDNLLLNNVELLKFLKFYIIIYNIIYLYKSLLSILIRYLFT